MINFILISHGELAKGILDATNLIMGKKEGVIELSLKEEDSVEGLKDRLDEALSTLYPKSDGVLILVDLFGASPFNVAAMVDESKYPKTDVVTGLNLPMFLEVLITRNQNSLSDLSKLAEESGINGIKVLSKIKSKL
jgi:mannose/fructose/sorbose-specific phosphotransferase system IIA component